MQAAGLKLTAEDMFWANLAGSMEAIDAGTTTTLDHAHMNWSKEHSKFKILLSSRHSLEVQTDSHTLGQFAIAGTISSGIRSIFGYTPVSLVKSTDPKIEFEAEPLPAWVMETFEKLATSYPLNDSESRVQLGFGFDFYHLPKNIVLDVFEKVKSLGVKVVTSHFIQNFIRGAESLPVLLKSYGLLQKGIVLSHAGGATAQDVRLIHDANCFVCATPNTELAMAVGPPVCFRPDLPGIDQVCSLGVDCHSATSGSMVNEMRTALQTSRGKESETHVRNGYWPRGVSYTTANAFKMGTIQGARALGMEKDIGSIQVGKKADLVVFDALSPAMACVAQHDPVMAIVLHSTIRDIETVLVDGEVRKQHSKLCPVSATQWHGVEGFSKTGDIVHWREVAENILDIQRKLESSMPHPLLLKLEDHVRVLFGHEKTPTKL